VEGKTVKTRVGREIPSDDIGGKIHVSTLARSDETTRRERKTKDARIVTSKERLLLRRQMTITYDPHANTIGFPSE
jgi:hypothetical protein